jgi:uncharacterized repeat protein (TIGR03803 family)
MSVPNFRRYAMGFCTCVVLLTGCGRGTDTLLSPQSGGPSTALRMTTAVRTNVRPAYGVIYSFGKLQGDGANPFAGLIQVNGTLYGTTQNGGKSSQGTVFKTTTSGKETVLKRFDSSDGSNPSAGLTEVDGTLYGTLTKGGPNDNGAVFAITSGKERLLHSFGGSDGAAPNANLVNIGGILYGTTRSGGKNSIGTVFAITTSGKETLLYSFKGSSGDGHDPEAGLINVNGMLYGTTIAGGSNGEGTVFSITTSGKESVLYSFAGSSSDGHHPVGGLVNVGGTLYGTTTLGGGTGCGYNGGCGTVFKITTSGMETVLYKFKGGSDGDQPQAALLNLNGTLYGTTENGGGTPNYGTVFAVSSSSGKEKVLHHFAGDPDGKNPVAALIDVKGALYGTTSYGGAYECTGAGCGVVFYLLLDYPVDQ